MTDVTLADAKAKLSELVEMAARGELVRITKRGKPVARIVAIERVPEPINLEELRAFTDSLTYQQEPASTWIRKMRDDERY
jgi:prevent-host-death family protein